jgi:hypothetical protein
LIDIKREIIKKGLELMEQEDIYSFFVRKLRHLGRRCKPHRYGITNRMNRGLQLFRLGTSLVDLKHKAFRLASLEVAS